MNELMQTHRSLCSAFVSEELYRRSLGGSRADISTVMRYLSLPPFERPTLSIYFDRPFYLATNQDVVDENLDPLLHFLDYGIVEHRPPHPLIDLKFIASTNRALLGEPPRPALLIDLLERDLHPPSPYFDPVEYRARLGGGAPAQGMLRHFLCAGIDAGLAPTPLIDPAWYAARYDDVPPDRYGALRHFIVLGDVEARAPSALFDGQLYRARYPDIATAGVEPLRHYLLHGRDEGRQAAADRPLRGVAPTETIETGNDMPVDPETVLRTYVELRARLADIRQRHKEAAEVAVPVLTQAATVAQACGQLRLPAHRDPRVSILIPVFNEIDYTLDCLLSLQHTLPLVTFEVIIADDCSTDPDAALLAEIANVTLLCQPHNVGFIRNCNAAFEHCTGEYVLLLNNDTKLLPGAVDRLVAALDADQGLAAAGPQLIYPDGRLQEAGCIVRPDGTSSMVGLFHDPAEPGFSYDRDVTYCSGAALMFRRTLAGETLFDEAFLPAYCEDADLCLRFQSEGWRIRYVHDAVIVHHLSVSTNRQSMTRKERRIIRNQQTLTERWGSLIARLNHVRVLAFYLPQFHPIPENDLWWGRGFTEWTNVARARPSYAGHYQPHLPADLGFYDLRQRDVLRGQAELAARYGIEGFCVYYYNFGSRRLLAGPIDTVRANPDIAFRWCICWANENWTKHWAGGDHEILIEQRYDRETLDSVIADVVDQASDGRYIRVDGKPLFLVYRPLLLPDPAAFAASARAAFRRAGFPGVHLVYVESMEAVDRGLPPASFGFDASVEFPPHGRAVPNEEPVDIVKEDWAGYRYNYPETIGAFVRRPSVAYTRYPAVFPSWDNTPRQPLRGTSFDGIGPESFRVYIEEKIDEIRRFLMRDERLLFVNAWNEWAEGAHLEPDSGYGHRWLEALRDATSAKRSA